MANSRYPVDDGPGTRFITWITIEGDENEHIFSLWEGLADHDCKPVNSEGVLSRKGLELPKGGWPIRTRFANITVEQAEACLMVATLNPAAWPAYARRFFK